MSSVSDFLRGHGMNEGGERWLRSYRLEPLSQSIARRVRMIWNCWTLRPGPDFHEEFRPFRRDVVTVVSVYPGDPGYEDADGMSPQMANHIRRHLLDRTPWIDLSKYHE